MRSIGILLACLTLGCSSAAPEPLMKPGAAHGGVLVNLPNKVGSVEVAVEAATAAGKRSASLIAYFYAPDGSSALTPTPRGVKVTMGGSPPIPLTPQERDGFVARFASAPGIYTEEVRGTVSADVGGQAVEVPFIKR